MDSRIELQEQLSFLCNQHFKSNFPAAMILNALEICLKYECEEGLLGAVASFMTEERDRTEARLKEME